MLIPTTRNEQNNRTLARLAEQDQKEREHFFDDPERVTSNDRRRRRVVGKLLKENKVRTSRDYFNAALIYQHGLRDRDYERARTLARLSMENGGGEPARWLYAVATDRLLTTQGRRQKFGTQFKISYVRPSKALSPRRVLQLLPYDRRTGDATRRRFGVPTLSELLKMDGRSAPRKQKKITRLLEK